MKKQPKNRQNKKECCKMQHSFLYMQDGAVYVR